MLNLKEFFDNIDWSDEKQELFLNFDQLPPEYLNNRVLKIWKELLSDLELFTTVYNSYEEVEKQFLKEQREYDLAKIDSVLEQVLTHEQKLMQPATESSSGRVRPAVDSTKSLSRESSGRVRPAVDAIVDATVDAKKSLGIESSGRVLPTTELPSERVRPSKPMRLSVARSSITD